MVAWPTGTVVHPEGEGAALIRCQLRACAVVVRSLVGELDWGNWTGELGVGIGGRKLRRLQTTPPPQTMQVHAHCTGRIHLKAAPCRILLVHFPPQTTTLDELIKLAAHSHARTRPKFNSMLPFSSLYT